MRLCVAGSRLVWSATGSALKGIHLPDETTCAKVMGASQDRQRAVRRERLHTRTSDGVRGVEGAPSVGSGGSPSSKSGAVVMRTAGSP